MSAPQRYTHTAIALHWLIALIIFCSFPLGLYMVELPLSPLKLKLYSWHKWAGVTIFALALLRIFWRIGHAPPAPVAMPIWQRSVAAALHVLLYALIFAVPVSGWLMSSASGFQVVWFGVLPLPDLLGKNKELAEFLKQIHVLLNYTLAALVIIHVAAALKHHWHDRDEVLTSMLPFLKSPRKAP